MGKRRRESDSDGAAVPPAEYNTVFVDTSLDTHLAMLVSDSDTVLDFKKKIVLDHMQCFPKVGEIKIQALKVKRRSNFYHLPDIMRLWSAVQGVKGNWFLSADVSTAQINQNFFELGASDCVKVKDADDCRRLSSWMETFPKVLPSDAHEGNGILGMTAGVKFDKSLERTSDIHRDTCSEQNGVESESRAKKKCKMRHAEDACHNPSLIDTCALVHASSDAKNDRSNVQVTTENINLDFDKRKEDTAALQSMKDVNSDANKRKKERASKVAAEIHSIIQVEQTVKDESTKLCTETRKSEEKEEDKKSLENAVSDLAWKESSLPHVLDAFAVGKPEISVDSKKKRRKKKKKKVLEGEGKPTDTNPGNTSMEPINGISSSSGLICASIDHNPEASDMEEGNLHPKQQDVQMKLLDGSSKDAAGEEIQSADGNGADFVALTQAGQTMEDTSVEKIVEKKAQIDHEGFPSIEKDQIGGFNQVDTNGKNLENKDKRVKKKRKRAQVGASDVDLMDADDGRGLSSDVNTIDVVDHEKKDVKNDQLNTEAMTENENFDSDRRKETMELGGLILECRPGQVVSTESGGVGSNEVPDYSTRLMDSIGVEDVTSNTSKRKKKKAHKVATEIQEKAHVEQIRKGENPELNSEIRKPEENKEEKSLSSKQEVELTIPSNKNDSDTAVPNPALKESMDAHTVVAPDISIDSKTKRKKKMKKGENPADTFLEKLGIEQPINGISGSSGLIGPSADHISEPSDKVESTLQHEGQDVRCAGEKVLGAVGNVENILGKKTQSSTGEDHKDFTSTEKDHIAGFNQVDRNVENTENKDKKTKKKRKKVQHAASDVSENLPVKVQKAGVEISATEESLVNLGRSEMEGRHEVLFNKSEEKVEGMSRTAASTGDFARSSENEGEQTKESGNVEKKATKSHLHSENGLPPIESKKSVESSEHQENQHQSCVRKTSGRRQEDSTHKSHQGELVEVKDSIPSEMQQKKTLQKPDVIHAASTFPEEKNASLNKSSLQRPQSCGNRRAPTDVNAAEKMLNKTPRKKSLLIKPGAIFHDNSGESSGDENGNVRTEFSIHAPSDNSTLSSNSESGESDLDPDLSGNGSDNAKDQSSGERNAAKLNSLSDTKEVTLDMILRSSKRFRHAKLLASQNEQENEVVPDSQEIESVP